MDSAPFHRKKRLRKLARGKVRLLFLPPLRGFILLKPDLPFLKQAYKAV
jgi:hypothetical protein